MNDNSSRVIEVDINDILPNRNQPRIVLNEEEDLGLTDSVKEYGVLQPIIVRTIGDKYEIIAGERRYRASVLAGKETVPVIIKNMTDKESAEIALIENVQRKELTPIEEALSYKTILDKGYMTQEQLAEKIGKSQPTIANKIRLLNLSDEVQDALLENQISERHARSLLKIKDTKSQNQMLDKIINERLTVRKTDEEIDKFLKEKGEDSMNNNEINNMPQFESFGGTTIDIPVQPVTPVQPVEPVQPIAEPTPAPAPTPVPSFDIFAGAEPVQPVAPVQPTPAPAPTPVPSFDIFAGDESSDEGNNGVQGGVAPSLVTENTFEPVGSVEPIQSTPAPSFDIFAGAEPVQATEPTPAPSFDIFAGAEPAQATEPTPAPSFDIFAGAEPVQAIEPTPAPSFDIFAGAEPVQASTPVQPVVEQAPVVEEAPVQTIEPTEVFTTAPVQEGPVAVEPAVEETRPEPIIITDYNKQYDPVMPAVNTEPVAQASFKDVITAIRECADKIESYGYRIDVDEFDLTNIYQAIFKIEKM